MLQRLLEMTDGEVVGKQSESIDVVKIKYAVPDTESRPGIEPGVMWVRNRLMKCPQCGDNFYFWGKEGEVYDHVYSPPMNKPDRYGWIPDRPTCGDMRCRINEYDLCNRISPEWIRITTSNVTITPKQRVQSKLLEMRNE